MSQRLYRNKFEKAYDEYNKRYFNNELPRRVRVKIVDPEKDQEACFYWGWVSANDRGPKTIHLTKFLKDFPEFWRPVLLHEICHVSGIAGHGKKFHARMTKLAVDGAFKDIW